MSRDELVSGLVRIGERLLSGEDEAEVDAYFAPDYRFHGPYGAQWDYKGVKEYFEALRAGFDALTITRGIVVAEVTTWPARPQSQEPSYVSLLTRPSYRCHRPGNGSYSS